MREIDVVVLGGGSAGTAAARTAAAAGCSTVMFNDGELGGLCILRGCMPTKTLLHAAHLRHEAAHHRTPGIGHQDLEADFAAVMANKDVKVERFQRAKINAIQTGGYQVVDARARFTGPDTVTAGDATWRFLRGAVIATGSVIDVPPIPGIVDVDYWTSDDVLNLTERPDSVAVIGSGAIGLEFAQFFARMGSRVELISRRPVFADAGPSVAEEMAKVLADEPNFTNHTPGVPMAVRRTKGGVLVEVSKNTGDETVHADHLLMATGRRAAVDDLDLDSAGIAMEGPRVKCGPDMRTTNPRVFVAGDATGDKLLLHVANWEGTVAGRGAAQVEGEHRVEQRLHMAVVFTDPPLATLGLTVAEAEAQGLDVVFAEARFPETGRAITMDVPHGIFRLVATAASGEIIGAQILGPRADDLIHTLSPIMYYRGTARQMLDMPWYHPTLSEVLLTLARDVTSRSG